MTVRNLFFFDRTNFMFRVICSSDGTMVEIYLGACSEMGRMPICNVCPSSYACIIGHMNPPYLEFEIRVFISPFPTLSRLSNRRESVVNEKTITRIPNSSHITKKSCSHSHDICEPLYRHSSHFFSLPAASNQWFLSALSIATESLATLLNYIRSRWLRLGKSELLTWKKKTIL